MPQLAPKEEDMPKGLTLSITPPPSTSLAASNVLILLHGIGDTYASFKNLGQQLSLPETACISLQGHSPLPFDLGGFHWGDDIVFDQNTAGPMDLDSAGYSKSIRAIKDELIQQSLIEKGGFKPREILLFGFGQGGMAALAALAGTSEEFGGIVSVGGPVPPQTKKGANKSKTPVLLLHGSSRSMVTVSAVQRTREYFESVQVHQWKRPGDSMPRDREEMLPIMQFFAKRLRRRAGVPEDATEIT